MVIVISVVFIVPSIIIESQEGKGDSWIFQVAVSDDEGALKFQVALEKEYWRDLTRESSTPMELVERSFKFLLEREPKESILKRFNLKQIMAYFPEYEEEMKRNIP